MKYMLLFCRDESIYQTFSDDEKKQLHSRYHDYGMNALASGKVSAGDVLEGPGMATSIRVRDGKRQVTDGPFAETVEALLGYMVVECDNLDEAIDWAARHPDAEVGAVEVRPVIEWSIDDAPGAKNHG